MHKKGQSWTIEFILAFLIFSSAAIMSIKIVSNIEKTTDFEDLMKESEILSSNLLFEGYPVDWNSTNVIRPGIITENRINSSKLSNFSSMDYQTSRYLLGMSHDFFIYFSDDGEIFDIFSDFGMAGKCGYGDPEILIDYNATTQMCYFNITAKYDNFAKISRLIVYDNRIITINIYVWD